MLPLGALRSDFWSSTLPCMPLLGALGSHLWSSPGNAKFSRPNFVISHHVSQNFRNFSGAHNDSCLPVSRRPLPVLPSFLLDFRLLPSDVSAPHAAKNTFGLSFAAGSADTWDNKSRKSAKNKSRAGSGRGRPIGTEHCVRLVRTKIL